MTRSARYLRLAGALQLIPLTASARTDPFADATLGLLPRDFVPALTGRDRTGRWEVVEDKTARDGKTFAQLDPDRNDYRFPLATYQPMAPAKVEVTGRFKEVLGQIDQAGGVAFRRTDSDNHYLARANALEQNANFYRGVGGVGSRSPERR